MAQTGSDFGVVLYRLYTVAKDYLPTLAFHYGEAEDLLYQSSATAVGMLRARPVFAAPEFQPPDLPDRVRESWESLAELTRTILTDTRASLEATAASLEHGTNEYVRSDAEAEAEFTRLCGIEDPAPKAKKVT